MQNQITNLTNLSNVTFKNLAKLFPKLSPKKPLRTEISLSLGDATDVEITIDDDVSYTISGDDFIFHHDITIELDGVEIELENVKKAVMKKTRKPLSWNDRLEDVQYFNKEDSPSKISPSKTNREELKKRTIRRVQRKSKEEQPKVILPRRRYA